MTKKVHASLSRALNSIQNVKIYIMLLGAAILWCTLFVIRPVLMEGSPSSQKISTIISIFFSPTCHQKSGRCIHIMGHPMAVCARCAGIYFGFLLGIIFYPFLKNRRLVNLSDRMLLFFAALPMAVEWGLTWILQTPSSNTMRNMTGLILGITVAVVILPYVFEIFEYQKQ